MQKSGKDWTVDAGRWSEVVDVARDTATRASMIRALSALGTTRGGTVRPGADS